MTNKTCTCCKTSKPINHFRKNGFNTKGEQLYKAKCKLCKNSSGVMYNLVQDDNKQCKSCNAIKPLTDFNKQGHTGKGFDSTCKCCRKNQREAKRSTVEGLLSYIYNEQIHSTRNRQKTKTQMCDVDYSKEWFINKYKNDPVFIELHEAYVAGGLQTCDKPTIDRINDDIGYTESNIQVMTVRQNQAKNGSANFTRYHAKKKGE